MLLQLDIRDFVVIESASITFGEGLNVMTGETGAGKSITIDALGLILGGRAQASWIRHGAKKAVIEALFQNDSPHLQKRLSDFGITPDREGNLIIRREILANGKSVARVNGQLVNLHTLAELGKHLITIYGQHEYQHLLDNQVHLAWLDAYGGEDLLQTKQAYQNLHRRYTALRKRREKLLADAKEQIHRFDLLSFQHQEISAARLVSGEEETLMEKRNHLAFAEKISLAVHRSYSLLYQDGGALDCVNRAQSELDGIINYDSSLKPVLELITSAYYQLDEAAHQLRDHRSGLEHDPASLEQVEQRLALINQLKRKYGESVEEILRYHQTIQEELAQLNNLDEELAELEKELAIVWEDLIQEGKALGRLRHRKAETLGRAVKNELSDLLLADARFKIEVSAEPFLPENARENGFDRVRYLFSAGQEGPLHELAQVASGGEMSRMMLAIKSVFAQIDDVPTLIFDEVDTGVSGRSVQAIAEKLKAIAGRRQVIAVTHHPQVTSMADQHFKIEKAGHSGRTSIRPLSEKERIMEMSRLLGGAKITETTIKHAQEMLELAKKQRIE